MLRLLLAVLALFWAFILLLVGGRFLLLLLDANRGSDLVDWILSRSEFWVEPFFGIFDFSNRAVEDSGGVFEPASLVALIVYAVIGGVIGWAINMALSGGYYGHRHHPIDV